MDNQMWPPGPISTCTEAELVEINKFRDQTSLALKEAFDMSNLTRSVWAPACPFHCYSRFGEVDDPRSKNYTVPPGSTQTLGEATHWLIFENLTVSLIDTVNYPDNALCANPTTLTSTSSPKSYSLIDQYTWYLATE